MIATASRRSHASAGRLLFFFLAAVLALTGLGGKASAATWSTTQTRVGASDPAPTTPVGAGGHITAGQRPGEVLPQPGVAQGHGVHTFYVTGDAAGAAPEAGPGTAVLVHNNEDPTAASNAARRDVMRKAGIPTSQQSISQKRYSAGYGKGSGYQYVYEVNGKRMLVTDNWNDLNADKPHGPHWEAGESKGKGVRDSLGRERVKSGKFTSFYRGGC